MCVCDDVCENLDADSGRRGKCVPRERGTSAVVCWFAVGETEPIGELRSFTSDNRLARRQKETESELRWRL